MILRLYTTYGYLRTIQHQIVAPFALRMVKLVSIAEAIAMPITAFLHTLSMAVCLPSLSPDPVPMQYPSKIQEYYAADTLQCGLTVNVL
ncbi:MAG: hypothetical protein COT33_00350 [Candidatus Nealsonbacteria bacterium CG08_land_8_20_14_0_20_38_20]|uniref:Uncharacterized protein n=1 Tax=Candidatus Nealsonbacteria bacterium CG08_land_8_20_14_0_20_38_20 TaxID=1974705 RepID=A0A2H0YMN0_9BACT|nr:MAG: hypothetical protein COT33_00350 [Candidatus Nealsonbacteria bacterium CG08_land_8_20_14_0_20_38_20]